jgi:hypothetical protein
MQGATATMLLTLDSVLGMLNVQNPPNEGVQAPRGRLSMSVPATAAFDIVSVGPNMNRGYVLAGGALHLLDLSSGALTAVGNVANLPSAGVIDIACDAGRLKPFHSTSCINGKHGPVRP